MLTDAYLSVGDCYVSFVGVDCNELSCLCFSYCNLLQFAAGDVQKSSLTQLMILLCHSHYPIVRKNTATKLYEAILTYPGIIPDDSVDDVTSLLIETLWSVVCAVM